jgi:protein TonB
MSRLLALGGSTVLHTGTVGLVLLAGAWGFRAQPARMAVAAPPPSPASLDVRPDRTRELPAFDVPVPLPAPLSPEDVELEVEPSEPVLEAPPAPRIAPDRPAPSLDRPRTTLARVVPPTAESAPSPRVEAEVAPVELHNPPPPYPSAARRRGQEGSVVVELRVLADGRVAEAKVVESEGPGAFVDAVLRTVEQWRYQPATLGGTPVECVQRVRFNFRLD